MTTPKPFVINVPQAKLNQIRKRITAYKWHEMPAAGGWSYGANREYLRELCDYWVTAYDWRAHERKLNHFSHFKTAVDGQELHFIHERGSGPNPQPLIISHGWPGSFFEFAHLIEPLAHPERFGGDAEYHST